MNENHKETFLTTLNDENQLALCDFNDDDMNIEVKSSADSEDTPRAKTEIEQILNKNELLVRSSLLIPRVESINGIENQT
jgi:hypothetical protein